MAYQIDKDDVLNENEFQELRTLLRGDNSRDAVLIEIALETGARSQEVLNITLGDIDLDQGTVYIRGIKGSLNRNLPISPALTKKVKRLVSKFKAPTNECRLFAIKTSRFRQIWRRRESAQRSFMH